MTRQEKSKIVLQLKNGHGVLSPLTGTYGYRLRPVPLFCYARDLLLTEKYKIYFISKMVFRNQIPAKKTLS